MSTKFVEILQNKFLGISWELFPRFSQEFLSNILSIFLSKFTNQDLGRIVVNNLTPILPFLVKYFVKKKWKFFTVFKKYFQKDGSKENNHFLSLRMQRKKDLSREVQKRREPQRHPLEKKLNLKILWWRNFSKLCLLFNSPKNPWIWRQSSKNFSGISRN